MPIYAYRCKDCGYEFEKRQRMMDDPLHVCPNCTGAIRRVVNSVGVVFKGSGFYITDSRNGKSTVLPSTTSNKNEGDASDTAPAKKESNTASDTTPSSTTTPTATKTPGSTTGAQTSA